MDHRQNSSNSELHGFAVWNRATRYLDDAIEHLKEKFSILSVTKVNWTEDLAANNFNRLYGRDLRLKESRHAQVGTGPFFYIVIEDVNPVYKWHKNVSGKIELVNINVMASKKYLRRMTADQFKYYIHSSNSRSEFNKDYSLIFGGKNRPIAGAEYSGSVEVWNQDLEGSHGWLSVKTALEFAGRIEKFVVLRDWEIIEANPIEVDVLCKDPFYLAGLLNARKITDHKSKYDFAISLKSGAKIKIDMRAVEDKYYPSSWARHLLERAKREQGIYRLDEADQYFSQVYHELLHKPTLRDEKAKKLERLRNKIFEYQINEFSKEVAVSDLKGYMLANDYSAVKPADETVKFNRKNAYLLAPMIENAALKVHQKIGRAGKSVVIGSAFRLMKNGFVKWSWKWIKDTRFGKFVKAKLVL